MSSPDEMPAIRRDIDPTPVTARPRQAATAVQQSLALPPVASVHKPTASSDARAVKRLWLCIYLPRLPFDALNSDVSCGHAVIEEQQGINRILMVDDEAAAAGIEPGLSVNAALSLCPAITLQVRDPGQEEALLKRIAAWAEQFTSFVVVEPGEDSILLEVAGSLRLFGGAGHILRRVERGLSGRCLTASLAVAPTPLASAWLARSGQRVDGDPFPGMERLSDRLAPVDLSSVGWPDTVTEKMRGMGIHCIGDCLRLPRQGFARRFGVRYLNDLDRALGRLPDPREHFRMPVRFSADFEFEAEQDDSELILNGCRELLCRLERFLRVRQVQIQRIQFSFFHLRAEATQLALGCVQAGQGVDHWFDLLRIRFEQVTLPEPAIAVRLRGGRGEAATLTNPGLLETGNGRQASAPINCLVERLSARMGESAVRGVTTVAEHRPQFAWRATTPVESPLHCAAAPQHLWNEGDMPALLGDIRRTNGLLLRRPLWILDEPEPLPVRDGRPLYAGGGLELEGPERLESGWWDDSGIARDYYVARTDDNVCLWIYRDRQAACHAAWYLHGMFG